MSNPVNVFNHVNSTSQNFTGHSFSLSSLSKKISMVAFSAIALATGVCVSTCDASSIFVRASNYTCEDFCRGDCTEFSRIVVGWQDGEALLYIFSYCLRRCLTEYC